MAWYDNYSKEDLAYKVKALERKVEELEAENRRYYDDREHYRFRVENELEPRIRSERRAYDNYVTDPERGRSV